MRYLFFGNRKFVLQELLMRTDNVEVGVISGSHLHRDSFLTGKSFALYESSDQVHQRILKDDFDILVSNGLPFKLKLSSLPKKVYVNIHPSFLPDLRGVDPVLGAILFRRDAGATCHIMDDRFDTGDIIAQIKIPFSDDLKASLLYQLSFIAERRCFVKAWELSFKPQFAQPRHDGLIYFTRNLSTRVINWVDSPQDIVRTVKAFDNKNQGAIFLFHGREYKCFDAWLSENSFLIDEFAASRDREVVLAYEDTLVVKLQGRYLFLSKFLSIDGINAGDLLA